MNRLAFSKEAQQVDEVENELEEKGMTDFERMRNKVMETIKGYVEKNLK